jgi:hypothetical protein
MASLEFSGAFPRLFIFFIFYGAPEKIRTPNLLIRSQMLYPIELRAHALRDTKHTQNSAQKQDEI